MTLAEMRRSEAANISIRDAAEVIGCNPQRLRDMLDIDEERPVEMRRFLFPHCKIGNRRRIMREGFLKWIDGTMLKEDLPGMSEIMGR